MVRRCATAVVILLSATGGAPSGQARRDPDRGRIAELRAAIESSPLDLDRYVELARLLQQAFRRDEADRVLREALVVDPTAGALYERRVEIFQDPPDRGWIGRVAEEWLRVDGTNPIPVLLAAGAQLHLASQNRGDGSTTSVEHVDRGLQQIDGALPANPGLIPLLRAKSNLLVAKAALVPDAAQRLALLKEAQALTRQVSAGQPSSTSAMPSTSLGPALAVMTTMPPFGPPGAVRAGRGVPPPVRIKHVPPVTPPAPPSTRRAPAMVVLELVIDATVPFRFPRPPR